MYSPDAPSLADKLGQAMATPRWRQAAKMGVNDWDTAEDNAAKTAISA